ncbi:MULTISPECIES: TadE family type IV pilus minor pilin [Arthrobacter]|uniref:TadE family type IV pilus minor pilin n=2 Tax=Arthrobacter TaxID=1663 RepID=A0ABU9KKZ9_9MICC|nr:TadE family type IV pilus minor pilin [Arthrobacter sp. YJM1]MDP5227572.1 TadE family type IV pilus minor pilin [Arthrobacter sp. YJM1]
MRTPVTARGAALAGSRGSVTAEFAVTLPALVLLLSLLMGAVAAGTQQLRLEEAARSAARAMARGETVEAARDGAARLAGGTVAVVVTPDGLGFVQAVVSAPAPGVLGTWTRWTLEARSTAAVEDPGQGGPS